MPTTAVNRGPWDEEDQQTIRLQFSPDRGLTVEGFAATHEFHEYRFVKDMKHLAAHASAIEANRKTQPGRQGEAILDFFLHNADQFRDACFGPPVKYELYFDETDVRLRKIACHPQDPDILFERKRLW